ncbi:MULTISPECIES: DNA alkylation repair protein [Corallococcus]|uniref:DNA alkylation repair protein n=1 Tax=Corallococcus llansteffanensis TaxID=2316731 RepID=A0A3A8PZ70_9BACT|nr:MULTISPECIES: DNA alkylation repair protein [Corallococcus]RKH12461.1 DNA alkylation repair protein [Corallococcus sp. CA053C]RKH57822.1 DNA alkylation repair protein [Corallococcus llansteffanensis]
MRAKATRKVTAGAATTASRASTEAQVQAALASLKRRATKHTLEGMARYAIPSDHAYGVAMRDIKALGKTLGRDHALASALWATGVYEARMLASFVADPGQLTPEQMDGWCSDFDNWAYCDAMSFNLFDRSPHAWAKVAEWSARRNEFEKRTAFALLWSLSTHDKRAGDEAFLHGLALIEREAGDGRNFVKKAVNMALRAVGKRNRALNVAAVAVARRLAASTEPAARWVGSDALRELTGPGVTKRLEGRARTT